MPTILLGFLLPWAWGISSRLLQQSELLLLTLDEGYLLTATLPDLQCGIAPLGPPVPVQPQLPGCGVAPPGLRPWPRTRGGSFQHFLCCHSLALLGTAPDLGRGVTLLGHRPSGMGSSQLLPLTFALIFLKRSLVFPILFFSSISLH